MVIFKGENLQAGWVPPDMDKKWQWTSNSKGWTCDNIGFEWLTRVFDPATRDKANGKRRALIFDGHGSHVQPEVLRFCIDNNISILLMPPHSSHLCQPLDVGVFSPLKTYMSAELDKIMRYGVSTIKKFEWAEAYRCARLQAMTASNIKSAFRAAGLRPLNRRKVLVRMPDFNEADLQNIGRDAEEINNTTAPVEVHPFAAIPASPSKITPTRFHRANAALITNIEAGIFDTPTRNVIPKLVALAEYKSSALILANHQNHAKDSILARRREHATGIRAVLKGQHVASTEELYEKVKAAKDATRARQAKVGQKRTKKTSAGQMEITDMTEEV
jgi:DDE superfamily endonuclease